MGGQYQTNKSILLKANLSAIFLTGILIATILMQPTLNVLPESFNCHLDSISIAISRLSYDQKAVYGQDIQYLKSLIESNKFATGAGKFSEKEILEEYKRMVISKIKLERPVRIVMDSGNATACLAAPPV